MMSSFSWTKQWYPLTPISYLDPSEPTPVILLGKRFVVWQDKHQTWVAMDDACPHKLAQLSLGGINDDGNLVCRHHGWCFDPAGKCVNIPMLSDKKSLETNYNSERSQVAVYPTQVLQGLLWIWPDNSANAIQESTLKQPPLMSEDKFEKSSSSEWFMSEVPVGYTVSLESSFDPSHAQFLHQGVAGFSPERAIPIQNFEVLGEISAEDGFTLTHSGYNIFNKDMKATRRFSPPCCNTTIYEYPNGKVWLFHSYFVPTKPGHCKYIGKFIIDGFPSKSNFWAQLLPEYLQTGLKHASNNKLGNQDVTMMHSQRINESAEDRPWQKSYFMPSLADIGIVTFRKWLDECAGGQPEWQGLTEVPFQELSAQEIYDRWHKHTKFCPDCRKSLVLITNVKELCQKLTVVLAVLALLLIAVNLSTKIVLIPVLVGILIFVLSFKLDAVRERFLSGIPKGELPIVKL